MMKGIFIVLPRRHLKKAATPISRHCGFTLIEISLSLVLLAICAALALPSYREMIEKRQSTHGTEQIETHSKSQSHRLEPAGGNTGLASLCSNDVNQAISVHNTCPDQGVQ